MPPRGEIGPVIAIDAVAGARSVPPGVVVVAPGCAPATAVVVAAVVGAGGEGDCGDDDTGDDALLVLFETTFGAVPTTVVGTYDGVGSDGGGERARRECLLDTEAECIIVVGPATSADGANAVMPNAPTDPPL